MSAVLNHMILFVVGLSWQGQPLLMLFSLLAKWINSILAISLVFAAFVIALSPFHPTLGKCVGLVKQKMREKWMIGGILSLCAWYLLLKFSEYFLLGQYDTATLHLYSIWNTNKDVFLPDFFVRGFTHMGEHFSPILILYSPLAWITHSPLTVIVLKSGLCLTSVFIFDRTVRELHCDNVLRWSLTLLFLFNWYFQELAHFFFSISQLATPIFLLVIMFWAQRRVFACVICALFLLTVKEEAGVCLVAFAVGCLFLETTPKRRFQSLVVMGVGIVGFLVSMAVIKHFSEPFRVAYSPMWNRIIGESQLIDGTLKGALSGLWQYFSSWAFPIQKFLPFLFLLLSTSGLAVGCVPGFLATALANIPHQLAFDESFHIYAGYYSAFVLPLVFWGTAIGAVQIYGRLKTCGWHSYLVAFLLLVAGVNINFAPIPVTFRTVPVERYTNAWKAIIETRKRPDASVAASIFFRYPLSFRKDLYGHSETMPITDLLLLSDRDVNPDSRIYAAILKVLPSYVPIFDSSSIVVWEHKRASGQNR